MNYTHLKDLVSHYTGLERDALHIHAALLIYLLVTVLFARSRRSILPWLIVLGVELGNEAHDLWLNWTGGPAWAIGESTKDLWNTMLWPTVLYIICRYTNWSFDRDAPGQKAGGPPNRDDETDEKGSAAADG